MTIIILIIGLSIGFVGGCLFVIVTSDPPQRSGRADLEE
jgi:hypothetical protein